MTQSKIEYKGAGQSIAIGSRIRKAIKGGATFHLVAKRFKITTDECKELYGKEAIRVSSMMETMRARLAFNRSLDLRIEIKRTILENETPSQAGLRKLKGLRAENMLDPLPSLYATYLGWSVLIPKQHIVGPLT